MNGGRALRVGIDVGGTFTDLVALECWSGAVVVVKLASTPQEPHRAVIAAVCALLARYELPPSVEFVGHATTLATNALLGQVGLELGRVALVTTEGFRDVIEIGRQNRSEVYNLFVERQKPLVARHDRLTVNERIDFQGKIVVALRDDAIERLCEQLRERDAASVAVCLLHSYANDIHERRIVEAIAARLPHLRVTRSSAIDPQYREYERCSTTVVNAALAPIVERYLEQLVRDLRIYGVESPLYVMRSDGGIAAAAQVLAWPAAMIESGPASGAVATAALGRRIRAPRLLSFDMGGTTAKAGATVDGVAQIVGEFEAAGRTHSGRAVKGSGYPVRFPFVDLAEISAGGGTIAWLDESGSLRVGPLSAGANPGPACYGTSDRPTVTDANVVLGRLNPRYLLGGSFVIDASRAQTAIEALARRLGMTAHAAAAGVVRLIDDAMARVLRIVTIERGLDPRDFTLVAFGGGGPLHACALAAEVGIDRIVIPARPGLFSAEGLLAADLRYTELQAVFYTVQTIDRAAVNAGFAQGEARARIALVEQGARPSSIVFLREYDARYRGQSFELTIEYDDEPDVVEQRFHALHRARYGYDVPGEAVEIVNARLTATGSARTSREPEATTSRPKRPTAHPERSATRAIWLDGAFADVPVFRRDELRDGSEIDGPAIVEGYDSTTFLAPSWRLEVDRDLLQLTRIANQP
ncbi:MAG: hydantoinase/oxoprolinase family protein [Candidatus Eremiobacteraeota bacterium]|nr:hydantoinase/oxoprolinase family protein [Candidatus Eremiobacteraeota bacterium]